MGTVLLIRHGQSVANANGVLAGRAPGVLLDEVGVSSAKELGPLLNELPVVQVVTSPLERTKQTSEHLFSGDIPLAEDERLIECDYGLWQGRLLSELATEPLWETVQKAPETMVFPEGESMADMAQRAVTCIREWDQMLSDRHGENVIWVAVSHGDVIKAICADALELPLRNFQRISIEPLSISVVQYGADTSRLHKLNDTGLQWLDALTKIGQSSPTVGGEVITK